VPANRALGRVRCPAGPGHDKKFLKFRNFHHIFSSAAMDRDKLIERLKKTRDPDERNRILEILSSHDGKETLRVPAHPGRSPAGKRRLGRFPGYVVGPVSLPVAP